MAATEEVFSFIFFRERVAAAVYCRLLGDECDVLTWDYVCLGDSTRDGLYRIW